MNNKKVVVLNDSSSDNHYGCSRVMSNLHSLIEEFGGNIIHRLKIGQEINNPETRNALANADIVIINGEGTFHHGAVRAERMLKLVDDFSLDKYLVNATYDSNPDEFASYLKSYKAISVRETKSQEVLADCGISSTVLPDLSFYSDSLFDEARSGFLFGDSVNDDVSWKILNKFQHRDGYTVNKIHFYGKKWVQPVTYFFKSLRKKKSIRYKVKRAFYQSKGTSPDAYHKSIAQSEGIVTGRYHAVCFAINSMTPFIAISSNSHKIEGLMEDIGLDCRVFKQEDISIINNVPDFELKDVNSIKLYLENGRNNTFCFYKKMLLEK